MSTVTCEPLARLSRSIKQEWDDFCRDGRVCLSHLHACGRIMNDDLDCALYAVPLAHVSSAEIVIGVHVAHDSVSPRVNVTLSLERGVLFDATVGSGMTLLLPHAVPLLAVMQGDYSDMRIDTVGMNARDYVYLVCVAVSRELRDYLTTREFGLGRWTFASRRVRFDGGHVYPRMPDVDAERTERIGPLTFSTDELHTYLMYTSVAP